MDVKFESALKAIDPHVNIKELCVEYGISRPTGHNWRNRFIQEGWAGLNERSWRPRISPNQTSEDILCDLIRIKVMHNKWGPKKIREIYNRSHPHEETPSLTTVKRALDKAGLVHHRKKRRQTPETLYTKSKRPFLKEIPEVICPTGDLVRTVGNQRAVTIDSHRVFASYALSGYSVGLRENKDETMTVWFDNLRLG